MMELAPDKSEYIRLAWLLAGACAFYALITHFRPFEAAAVVCACCGVIVLVKAGLSRSTEDAKRGFLLLFVAMLLALVT